MPMSNKANRKMRRLADKVNGNAAQEQSAMTVSQTSQKVSIHRGPLPLPEQLEAYEKICNGAADRILHMAEEQSKHRQYIERKAIDTQTRNSTLGVVFAFLLGLSTIVCGTWISLSGDSIFGFASMLLGLTSLVGVFVYGKRANKKELEEKQKIIDKLNKNLQ